MNMTVMVKVWLGGHDRERHPGGRVLNGRGLVIMCDITSVCDSKGVAENFRR